ncbi:hypothetical protein Nepgr_014075 [Nepenthes gracilis]|uniref:Uncharacterized protein n=1 Tax=Nepenthes gracilis TaxID=150966 RepID=A0AAD3SK43_NEPGR|nr:hypothetical protein Nepgr_014075 [Nepenthes gracilis]
MGIAGNCMLTRGLGFLKHLLSSIATSRHSISTKKRCLSNDFFPKRSRSVDPIDAHLSEAIKDCIEYFHSCSAEHRDSC